MVTDRLYPLPPETVQQLVRFLKESNILKETPFRGRYRIRKLPDGLDCSDDVFSGLRNFSDRAGP